MDTSHLPHLFSPIAGLLLNSATQILRGRRPGASLLRSIFLGFAVGGGATLALDAALFNAQANQGTSLPEIVAFNLFLYGMLGYCYFHTINLAITARRIRILRSIARSATPPTEADIVRSYNSQEMVHKRIDRLLKSGQIHERNGRYHIRKGAIWTMTMLLYALRVCVYGAKGAAQRR